MPILAAILVLFGVLSALLAGFLLNNAMTLPEPVATDATAKTPASPKPIMLALALFFFLNAGVLLYTCYLLPK